MSRDLGFPRLKMSAHSRTRRSGAVAAISQSLFANLVIAFGNMAVGILVARHLGASGRGEVAELVTLPTVLPYFMTLGLPSATIFEIKRAPNDAGSLMGICLLVGSVAALASVILGILLAPVLLNGLSDDALATARWLMIATAPNVLITYLMIGLQARDEFLFFNRIRYFQPLGVLLWVLLLDVTNSITPVSVALAVLFAGLPGTLWCLAWVFRNFAPDTSNWKANTTRLLPYALRSYSADLLIGISTQIDKVIVVALLLPSAIGLYVVATNLSRTLLMFAQAVTPVLFPKAAGLSEGEALDVISKASAVTALFVGLSSVFLFFFGPLLLRVLYGSDFVAASLAFRILVLEASVTSIVQVMSQAFMALNRPALVTLQYALGGVVAIALLLVLAPRFGASGAATAMLLAAIARLASTYVIFDRSLKLPAPKVWRGWQGSRELLSQAATRLLRLKSTTAKF